jgi:hypothetical protein
MAAEPGASFAYHAITIGFPAGEILRRPTSQRPALWLHNHFAAPLILDIDYGADPELAPIENPLPNGDPRLESSYRNDRRRTLGSWAVGSSGVIGRCSPCWLRRGVRLRRE